MLLSSQRMTLNEEEHVVIQPDEKVNIIIHQMITLNEKVFYPPAR
jgi:hypothetical protein